MADFLVLRSCLALVVCLLGLGCETTPGPKATVDDQLDQLRWGGLDLGDDWIDKADSPLANARTAATGSRVVPASYWSILLGTFSDQDHAAAATRMIANLATIDPRLMSAHVNTNSKGSMVVFGAYEKVDAEDAQADLDWVQSLTMRNRPVFPRAMLTRIKTGAGAGGYAEHALLSLRERYPDINPLYSLQVAVWGTFEGEMKLEEVQRRAELQVQQLRTNGHEAFVHHDPDREMSMVTVGKFDHTAIDAETSLFSPDVEYLFGEFPVHLVNGEPLNEPIDRRRPELGTRPQAPRLVLVPKL